MDIVLVLLRLLHIVSAFAWVGLGTTLSFLILPAAQSAGDSGLRFLKAVFTNRMGAMAFPVASGVTMLAGILLYVIGAPSHFSQTGNIVLGIGALAGIVAGIHGGAVTGRASRALTEALVKNVPDGNGSIPADAVTTLHGLLAKLAADTRISFALSALALLFMGSARYL